MSNDRDQGKGKAAESGGWKHAGLLLGGVGISNLGILSTLWPLI